MSFVVDASVTAAWCFPDENQALADAALDELRNRGAMAPAIWRFEVRNLLIIGERRGRIDAQGTALFLRDLASLHITVDTDPDETVVMTLSRDHRLTVYDAAYLELATRSGLPLATLDRSLAAAAQRAGIAPLAAGTP